MLTHKQKELLEVIIDKSRTDDIVPSYEEMADLIGLKSKSGVHRIIDGLEERGYIRRLPNRHRAIEVIKSPEGKTGYARLALSHARLLAALKGVAGEPTTGQLKVVSDAAIMEAWAAIDAAPEA